MRVFVMSAVMAFAGAGLPNVVSAQADVQRDDRVRASAAVAPPVDLWLDQISFDRGARMRPHVTTEPGAYLVVLRVTPDGELRVLYPERPRDQRRYALGSFPNDAVPYAGSTAFYTHESSGNGFVFAIASYDRFDFTHFTQGITWKFAQLADFRRVGDPFEVVRRFMDRVLPQTSDYSLDYEIYEVYGRGRNRTNGAIYSSAGYWELGDYHNACLSAFGYRMSYYCRSYRGNIYGPIIIASNPRAPRPRNPVNPRGKGMKPPRGIGHEPVVPRNPVQPVEGTPAKASAVDNAERDYESRLRTRVLPRQESENGPSQRSSNPRFGNPRTSSPVPEARRMPEPRQPVIYRTMPQREQRAEPSRHQQQPRVQESHRAEPRAPVGSQAPREHNAERARSREKN